MRKCDSSTSKSTRKPEYPGGRLKNKGDIDLWSLSGGNPSSGSEQTEVVVTARASNLHCWMKLQ